MNRLRVLHLEDSRVDAELVREMLAANGLVVEADRVETRDQFVVALDRGGFDLIIADYSLPAFDGMTALELARERCPDIPFLFVTGALKDDSAVETLRRGATDFIVKHRLVRLVPAVQRAIREREERQQRARAESALQFISNVSARLASSLDLSAILGNLTRLAIPTLADFCVVDVHATDGEDEHFAAAHIDASRNELLNKLRFRSHLMPSGVAMLYDVVPEDRLRSLAMNPEQLQILTALAPRSLMLVPLLVGGRVLGSIAFGISESARHYDGRDLATAKSLAERTAVAVENARLYREVQREVKSRKDLLAVVSHDLRNPLQNILMTATMLEHQLPPGDPLRARVETITRSSALASRLLGDLLDLARFEAGNLVLDRRVQDLAPIVRDSLDGITSLAEHKRIKILNAVRPGTVQAFCDRTRVLQILGNLIGNAIKFTHEGGAITINARTVAERNEVQISVTDTGIGIASRDVPHLFERYWQAKTGGGGVGLGLSIVKALVEAQGGRVSVTSDIGRGSTFTFTLSSQPVATDRVDEEARTVLVVDDDAETRITVAQVLEETGYRTLTACDGLEALELLRREPQLHPSVILLDLQMPRMDARAFCEEQQRDPALKDIAVIVFSANDDVATVARELHVSGYLNKPVGIEDLLRAVEHRVPVTLPATASGPQLQPR